MPALVTFVTLDDIVVYAEDRLAEEDRAAVEATLDEDPKARFALTIARATLERSRGRVPEAPAA